VSRNHGILYGATFLCAAILTGCGIGTINTSGGGGTMSLQGNVHGGQQGVVGAVVQLYTVGVVGKGTGAIPLLRNTVTTGADGYFSITKDYTCGEDSSGSPLPAGASNQVYLVATGGDPGVGADNPALVMVSALGSCSALTAKSSVYVNELTTVAAAWALAPFATSAGDIMASATNGSGVTNAFLDANLLANSSNGALATLPDNLSVETSKVSALADALASCVNSNGGTACTPLFTAATEGSVPTDTFTAALNIVKNPGKNVAKVFSAIGTYVPFSTSMTTPPNDWTMSLSITGGGLDSPNVLALDAEGNVWVDNTNGPLSAFGPQGSPLSGSPFGAGDINNSAGLTVDANGDIWVTNYDAGSNGTGNVVKFYGASSSGTMGNLVAPGFETGIAYPNAIASDTNGNVFVVNSINPSATVLTTSGTVYTTPPPNNTYSAFLGQGQIPNGPPEAIAVDSNHGFWLPDDDRSVAHISADGVEESLTNCCFTSIAVATDSGGNAWLANYGNASFSEVASDGATVPFKEKATGGLDFPTAVAIDGAQDVWFANYTGDSISEIAGNGGSVPVGTGISPSTGGPLGKGGYGTDAPLDFPSDIAPDRSGNLWVSSTKNDTIVMFFGLGTPTTTPLLPGPNTP